MRFTVGFFKRLFRKTVWPCDIAVGVEVSDKNIIEADYRRSMELIASRSPAKLFSPEEHTGDEGLPQLRYGTVTSPLPADWTLTPFPNLGNLYAGNLPFMAADANFFSFARINDGMLDLVNIRGDIPMHKSIAMMLSVGEGTLWKNPDVTYRKVSGFRVIPHQREGYISVDGERYPFEPFQVEVHKGLGCTLTPKGRFVGRDEIV
jgi:sphingosine kinase